MTTRQIPPVAEREFAELVQLELRLAAISVEAKRLADNSGLSRRAIAERMDNSSPSNLQRLLGGMAYKASVETLARFAWACGQELRISFVPQTCTPRASTHKSAHQCDHKVIDLASYREAYAKDAERRSNSLRTADGSF